MSPEFILAFSGFFTAILAAIGTLYAHVRSARKDEVMLLREEVARLHEQVNVLEQHRAKSQQEYETLLQENRQLKTDLTALRIQILSISSSQKT